MGRPFLPRQSHRGIVLSNPKPDSENPKFIEKWLMESDENIPDYKTIAKQWEGIIEKQTCDGIDKPTQLTEE